MTITFTEHEGCFSFNLAAETMQDAALIARFAINATSEIRHLSGIANQDGTFTGGLVIAKHKRADGFIQRRK